MTFETFARLLKQRLINLGYKKNKEVYFDDNLFFYIEDYYDSLKLFKINYNGSYFQYAASPKDQFWTPIYDFTFTNLKELYELAKKYTIDAKEKKIKDKLNEINKDFQ